MNPRLQRRPQWRGFPVPFFATARTDGSWDFKIVSEKNRVRCAIERLCWVCGEPLEEAIVFLGGPAATKARLYNDGPMHADCADDSLALCPFMIGTMDYATHFDFSKNVEQGAFVTGIDRPAGIAPPDVIYRYVTTDFGIVLLQMNDREVWFFHPHLQTALTAHERRPHANGNRT